MSLISSGAAAARLAAVGVGLGVAAAGCTGYELSVGYGLYPPPAAGKPQVTTVLVREMMVDPWPRQLAKGKVVFDLTNEGALAHSLALVGPRGREQRVGEELAAGEHQRAVLDLEAGVYKLLCPDGDHARQGMSSWIEIEDEVGWFRR